MSETEEIHAVVEQSAESNVDVAFTDPESGEHFINMQPYLDQAIQRSVARRALEVESPGSEPSEAAIDAEVGRIAAAANGAQNGEVNAQPWAGWTADTVDQFVTRLHGLKRDPLAAWTQQVVEQREPEATAAIPQRPQT